MIPWADFAAGLRKILTNITRDEENVLRYIIGMITNKRHYFKRLEV